MGRKQQKADIKKQTQTEDSNVFQVESKKKKKKVSFEPRHFVFFLTLCFFSFEKKKKTKKAPKPLSKSQLKKIAKLQRKKEMAKKSEFFFSKLK
jgi:hypothetical protein